MSFIPRAVDASRVSPRVPWVSVSPKIVSGRDQGQGRKLYVLQRRRDWMILTGLIEFRRKITGLRSYKGLWARTQARYDPLALALPPAQPIIDSRFFGGM